MADSVFHKDFKSMPWWWEWWHPSNELSQDPPRKTDVLVVGAGYGGLSTALELARSGVEVTAASAAARPWARDSRARASRATPRNGRRS